MSSRPDSKLLSATAVRALLDSTAHERHRELSEQLGFDFFVLADGSALIALGQGQGRLYASFDEFVAWQRKLTELQNKGPVHVLGNLIPDGRDFVRRVPELVRKLPEYLRLPASALDLSEGSLRLVDDAIKKFGRDRLLSPDHCSALTAYVGEIIRLAVGGQWDMRLDEDGAVWEPWIVDSAGRGYPAFMFVKVLYEAAEAPSLHGFVLGQLQSRRLGGPGSTQW
jgi:hypothetical protein